MRRAKAGGQIGEDYGHDRFFPEAFYDLLGRVGEQCGFLAFGFFDASRERAGKMDGVGVGEEQPLAAGDFGSGGDGIVLAGPSGLGVQEP